RHTRSKRDWSSDVCSSDLTREPGSATQMVVDPGSRVPMVGASGAISGVMGAYIVLYPRVRVHTLITLGFFFTTVTLPAYAILGRSEERRVGKECGSRVGAC